MNICMTGIDHSKASLEVREKFSFTKTRKAEILQWVRAAYRPAGCVLINTCNRTELWLSGECAQKPYEILCAAMGMEPDAYREYFVNRSGKHALRHLFMLACGLKSMVFAEDQIITQVKESLKFAREQNCTDALLDKVFLTAVSAAKRVKTQVALGSADQSAAKIGVLKLCEHFNDISKMNCLVIGNGEMGRMTAGILAERGCKVCVTVRQYTRGEVIIPDGCRSIPYDDRYAYLARADAVVSATTSPHYTLKKDRFILDGKKRVLVDLAVPRDIEPEIAEIAGTIVYDMDDLHLKPDRNGHAIAEAMKILDEYMEKMLDWYYFRDLAPQIDEISRITAQETIARSSPAFKQIRINEESREFLMRMIQEASKNAVSSLLYGLKDGLSRENVQDCMEGLRVSALKQKGSCK